MDNTSYTAFKAQRLLAHGGLEAVLKALKADMDSSGGHGVLVFDDSSGRQLDFDLRGTLDEVLERNIPERKRPGRGRPSLGVTSAEVSLLPRHWDWLARQPNSASAALRRLVDQAIKAEPAEAAARGMVEAADRELWVLAGNQAGCEEASRALYAGQFDRFRQQAAGWPPDVAAHLIALARRAEDALQGGSAR